MKDRCKKLSHTLYECKYHIVICPKYRHKIFHGEIAEYTKQQIYSLCQQKDLVEILELNIVPESVEKPLNNNSRVCN
jgi:putative transposase